MINWDADTWAKVISVALSIGAIVYAWFANRRKDVDTRFDGINEQFKAGSKRMDGHDKDITALKQTVDALPAKEDVHRLELAMVEMAGEMKVIGTHMAGQKDVMKRLETVVTRHEDHLLDGSKNK